MNLVTCGIDVHYGKSNFYFINKVKIKKTVKPEYSAERRLNCCR